jgi:hypothetical protein
MSTFSVAPDSCFLSSTTTATMRYAHQQLAPAAENHFHTAKKWVLHVPFALPLQPISVAQPRMLCVPSPLYLVSLVYNFIFCLFSAKVRGCTSCPFQANDIALLPSSCVLSLKLWLCCTHIDLLITDYLDLPHRQSATYAQMPSVRPAHCSSLIHSCGNPSKIGGFYVQSLSEKKIINFKM